MEHNFSIAQLEKTKRNRKDAWKWPSKTYSFLPQGSKIINLVYQTERIPWRAHSPQKNKHSIVSWISSSLF